MSVATSPTRAVLAEIEAGAGSVDAIAQRTGLDSEIVRMAMDRLVSSGHLTTERMQVGCPSGGCQECRAGMAGRPGCAAPASGAPRGPVVISLSTRRR